MPGNPRAGNAEPIRPFPSDGSLAVATKQRQRVNLQVGAAHVAIEPTEVWTVLGSCVSVVLHVPNRRISAICHAQLPERANSGFPCHVACKFPCHRAGHDSGRLKFVTCSVDYMMESLAALGVTSREISAAVIGGAQTLQVLGPAARTEQKAPPPQGAQCSTDGEGAPVRNTKTGILLQSSTIGNQNVQIARRMLSAYGVECRNEDVGGNHGRTLSYESDTGRIQVRHHAR